jgi:hypothetical protein
MTRRRIAVDLCTYTQDQTNGSPYCRARASFTVDGEHRVCLKHVGHAVEVVRGARAAALSTASGDGCVVVSDHESDGSFTDADSAS